MNSNKTKIIATLGPSSTALSKLKSLIQAGVNVFRVNFSHASHAEVLETVSNIRKISTSTNTHVAILGDLQGPKIRLGTVEENSKVKKGDLISITTNRVDFGNSSLVSINYPDFPKDVSENEKILVDDGKLIFKVVKTNKKDLVEAKVVQGGDLKSKRRIICY
jgi:pyruvate kinase